MMSTSYRHLTINEREKIMILLAQGKKQAEIAKALGRSSSTISR
ncbi:IS30 family transposase, partial [Escherichia coli]